MIKPFKHVHDTGAYQYAIDVVEGKQVAGKFIIQAAKRFLNDLERDELYMDLDDCRKIVNYALLCKHWKGPMAGQRIELRPDQHFYLQQLFGWRWKETGLRRIRRSYKQIARKTGKTTELAIQGQYHTHVDNKQGPQFWVAATNEKQARICITDIAQIVQNSEDIRDDFLIQWRRPYASGMTVIPTKGIIGAISRDTKRIDGLDVSMAGIDEWHEHETTAGRDILSSAMANRLEPIESIITTAGFNIHGPCYQISRAVGIQILDGIIEDDEQLVIICEMDNYEDWENEDLWIQSNPNIPYSQTHLRELQSQFKKAKNEGGSTEVNFKTKHLNMWVNSPDTWIDHELLKKNNHGITEQELIGKECYGGLDLAKGIDLNAFALFFPNVRPGIHAVKMYFWIPDDKIEEDKREADYRRWVNDGFIESFPGGAVEPSRIATSMIKEMKKYNVKSLGADSKYFYTGPCEYLHNAGYGDVMYTVPQGYGLSGAYRQIESMTAKKEIDLMNNPVLMWNYSNVVIIMGANGDLKADRKDKKKKIDGVVAKAMAVHEYMRLSAEPKKQVGIIEMKY